MQLQSVLREKEEEIYQKLEDSEQRLLAIEDLVRVGYYGGAPPLGMALIPAGDFVMGDTFGEGDPDELPLHGVTLSAFYMDKYEVTNAQYGKFVQATGNREPSYWYDDDYNPIDISLDPFTNVGLGLHLAMPGWNDLRLHFTFENLLNTDTSFFPEYPEPGLRVNGGISILL